MTKAVISFKTIHANIKKVRSKIGRRTKICAVVKANAYSLGMVAVSREIQERVDYLAVSNIDEAKRLRNAGISKPILMFGVCKDYKSAIDNNIIVTISSVKEMKKLAGLGRRCRIHIEVNTGMNRYGISNIWQLKKILCVVSGNSQIVVDGLYTQMAYDINNVPEVNRALKRFAPFRSMVKSHFPRALIHAACTNNFEHVPAQFDMVRIGKAMYGGHPGFKTAIKVTSTVDAIQNLARGDKASYNGTEAVTRVTVAGIIPCGYADLIHYRFSNVQKVLIDGVYCKVLGRVCMDSIIVDVTDVPDPLGKVVTIIDNQKGLTLMDVAVNTKTIVCNILCSFNFARVQLIYK